MSNNEHLLQRLYAIQQSLMAQHAAGQGLPNASSGAERETFLREFLQKVFPAHRRFSTGSITDSAGNISGQIDIAVEYGSIPSFPMPSTEERLMLAESIAAVIEVKSDLSSQWGQVRESVRKVKAQRRELNPVMWFGDGPGERIPCIAVGYTGHNTIEGLEKRLASTPENERPDGALVVESGCFSGFGIYAIGPLGLYALTSAINHVLTSLGHASPNLFAYVADKDENPTPRQPDPTVAALPPA